MTIDKSIYYISLGDSLALGQNPYQKTDYGYSDYIANYFKSNKLLEFYTKNFAQSELRTTELTQMINDNKSIKLNNKKLTIKNALIKADLVTISIGTNDLLYKLRTTEFDINDIDLQRTNKYIDDIIIDMDQLFAMVRTYCKEKIIIVGYYNPFSAVSSNYARELEPVFNYANKELKNLAKKYNISYVDIYYMFKESPDYLPNPKDIHPNNEGYEAIASQIIDIIENKMLN